MRFPDLDLGAKLTRRDGLKFAFGTLLIAATGCTPVLETERKAEQYQLEVLMRRGLIGLQELIDLRSFPGFNFNGSIAGFIGVNGSIQGDTKSVVQFAWNNIQEGNNRIIISEVPLAKVGFNVPTDNIAKRTALFEFNIPNLTYYTNGDPGDLKNYYITDSNNSNDFLQGERLKRVTISLSASDFQAFRK